jgi:hypothetical protein
MNIKNHKDLFIRSTSNGVIVSEAPKADKGYYAPELAVFNDPDEMATWIKEFFLNDPNADEAQS